MRKLILLAVLAMAFVMPSPRTAAQDGSKSIVTAAQVNGTWRSRKNEFKILALGKNQLKVEFEGTYEYTTGRVLMANTGELSGTATIEGTVATLKPLETEDGCTITLSFKAGKMAVSQEGECGFGAGVSAGGSYRRVSARKPTFSPE
jgi:hypothetical protein